MMMPREDETRADADIVGSETRLHATNHARIRIPLLMGGEVRVAVVILYIRLLDLEIVGNGRCI